MYKELQKKGYRTKTQFQFQILNNIAQIQNKKSHSVLSFSLDLSCPTRVGLKTIISAFSRSLSLTKSLTLTQGPTSSSYSISKIYSPHFPTIPYEKRRGIQYSILHLTFLSTIFISRASHYTQPKALPLLHFKRFLESSKLDSASSVHAQPITCSIQQEGQYPSSHLQ